MTSIKILAGILAGFIVSGAVADAPAAPSAPAAETRIPFANHGGIYNWQVINDRTVLIQGQNRKWYKATLMSSCFDLSFSERLGFESNSDGSFDKFSSIKTHGQNCPLTSLVETTPPPRKVKAGKAASAAPASPAQ
jgi:hypothetical protein